MNKLGTVALLVAIVISANITSGEAGWKKRGWYMKTQTAECVMRKVTVVTESGKVIVRKIRVCG